MKAEEAIVATAHDDVEAVEKMIRDSLTQYPQIFGGADIFTMTLCTPAVRAGVVAAMLACLVDQQRSRVIRRFVVIIPPGGDAATVRNAVWTQYANTLRNLIRPATSYTNGVKRILMKRQNIGISHIHEYELDHIIPLALGGHPRNPTNLMLQPWEGAKGAKVKDKLEVRLQRAVCKGKIPLREAQACIAESWIKCGDKYPAKRPH